MNRMMDIAADRMVYVNRFQDRQHNDQFAVEIMDKCGDSVIYQLHSDPPNVYRSAPLNGQRPSMGKILDRLAERIGRDLKSVYDYRAPSRCYKVSFANYVK